MRDVSRLSILAGLSVLVVGIRAFADEEPKPEVAVFGLLAGPAPPGFKDEDRAQLRHDLESAVISSGAFSKVHLSSEIESAMQRALQSGKKCETSLCEAELAGGVGADQYVKATLLYRRQDKSCTMDVRIFDAKGALLRSAPADGRCDMESLTGLLTTAVTRALAGAGGAGGSREVLGTLSVVTDVDDVDVFIDGQPMPLKAGRRAVSFDFNVGPREVKLLKPGHIEHVERVDIIAGKTKSLSATLPPEQAIVPQASPGSVTTILRVDTTPPGAVISLDGKPLAQRTPVGVPVSRGKHRIRATLELHHAKEVDVDIPEGQMKFIPLTLAPAYGALTVGSKPPGAAIYLDGRQVGITGATPWRQPRQRSGTFNLRLSAAYYHDHRQSVTVEDGRTTDIDIELRPSVGRLMVTSKPDGAIVTVDGVKAGSTPVEIPRLPGGSHLVELSRPHYAKASRAINVREGLTTPLHVDLDPRFSSIRVRSKPDAAEVFLDGRRYGTTPLDLDVIDEGAHEARVVGPKGAYRPFQEAFTVVPGTPVVIDAQLTPVYGRLAVLTDPVGAEIVLDGKPLGEAPQIVPQLLGGSHRLTVSHRGYRTVSQDVWIDENQESKVETSLTRLLPREEAEQLTAEWESQTSGRRVAFWGSVAGAAVLAGATTFMALRTSSRAAERDSAYDTYLRTASSPDDVATAYDAYATKADQAEMSRNVTIGLGAATAAAIGASIWLWSRIPSRPKYEVDDQLEFSFAPFAGRGWGSTAALSW